MDEDERFHSFYDNGNLKFIREGNFGEIWTFFDVKEYFKNVTLKVSGSKTKIMAHTIL